MIRIRVRVAFRVIKVRSISEFWADVDYGRIEWGFRSRRISEGQRGGFFSAEVCVWFRCARLLGIRVGKVWP